MYKVKLPKGLLLGAASAATQIEGGDYNNNWYQWSQLGKIKDGGSSIVACDHWNRYKEDIQLMSELKIQTYRMSIEWSRIEPQNGVWSEEGITHYMDEIDLLLKENILPLITLHHFSSPIWIQDIGGWKNKKTINYFVRFCEKVVTFLGDRVSEYCTINEPNVFVNDTYMDGKYPGGEQGNIFSYFKASKNLIKAHVLVYDMIHTLRKKQQFKGTTKVGIVPHFAYLELNTKNPFFRLTKKFIDHSFHGLFIKGMLEGKLTFPFLYKKLGKRRRYSDFIGINYYTRSMISPSFDIGMMFGKVHYKENLTPEKKTDLDWEIFPEGLYRVIKKMHDKYSLPIYITENGIADKKDIHRSKFIHEHLYQVSKLIEDGVNVERFYYWSLTDNMEWDDGYGPCFGLIDIDYSNQKRTIRQSGYDYKKIIETRTVEVTSNDKKDI